MDLSTLIAKRTTAHKLALLSICLLNAGHAAAVLNVMENKTGSDIQIAWTYLPADPANANVEPTETQFLLPANSTALFPGTGNYPVYSSMSVRATQPDNTSIASKDCPPGQ